MKAFEYQHVVGLEETNVVGNVYFTNHFRWQGRCREMFLRAHAPDVLEDLTDGLALVTTRATCDYLSELEAFDELTIRMWLEELGQSRISMRFEYWRRRDEREEMVAKGTQDIACMRREGDSMVATPVPESLRTALRRYA